MSKVKSKTDLQMLEGEIRQLREQNTRLNDSLLLLKEQCRRERIEKQMYMSICHRLSDQLKKANVPSQQSFNFKSNILQSQNYNKGGEDVYDRIRDRAAMAASMDPSMFEKNTQQKADIKLAYKKKTSAQLEIQQTKTGSMIYSINKLVEQTSQKKLKTLKDLKMENNLEQLAQSKQHQHQRTLQVKGQKPRRQTYFEKMRNK